MEQKQKGAARVLSPVPGYIVADFAAGGKDMYFFDLRVQEEDVLSLACQRPPKRKT